LQWLVRATLALIGVRVTALDWTGARTLLERIGLFAKGPSFLTTRTVYVAASAASAQPGCGEAELERALNEALTRMQVHRLRQMKPHEKENLRTALMLARGINACYRIGPDALAHADVLEAQGTNLARAAALRVRFTYYVVRGMRERAEQYRHELDILAIQGGTTWQVEWFAVPIEGVASARFGDVVGAGQALERLERLVEDVPSLKPLRDMVRMGYDVCRGDPSAAIALGEKFVAAHPPYGVIGWAPAYAVYAAALTQVGQPQAARDLCQRALSAMRPGDAEFSVMYGPLQQELATATAALGDLATAHALADGYIQRLEEAREYALLAHVWAVRVRMIRKMGEHQRLAEALVALRDAAERSDSTTVLNQALRVTQASLRASAELERAHVSASEPPGASSSSDFDSSDADTPARGLPRVSRHVLLKRTLNRADAHAIVVVMAADRDAAPRVADAVGEPVDDGLVTQVLAQTRHDAASGHDDDDAALCAFELVRAGPYFCEVVRLPLLRGHRHALVLVWRASPEVGATGTFLAQYAKALRRDQAAGESATREISCSNGAGQKD
jgi:tetratricopeptide (TPR) repeat protein